MRPICILIAFIFNDFVVGFEIENASIICDVHHTCNCVVMPVGDTVADHVAFEIDIMWISGTVLLFVVILDLVSQVWNINATVRLTRNVQIILFELGELFIPFLKEFHVVLGAAFIGMVAVII